MGFRMVLDQGSCRIYETSPGAYLGICERPGQVEPGGVIFTLVSPDVDAWHQRLLGHGVTVEKSPQVYEQYHVYHAFYRDPDGHLVEIQRFLDPDWNRPG
jgi:catechol 2,3-dioxygenase-like lactoylglutathione lyase family enzyme